MSMEPVAAKAHLPILLISVMIGFFTVVSYDGVLAAETHEVGILKGSSTLADKSYSPNPIEIASGDSIRFVNEDSVLHTATSGDGPTATSSGIFDTGFLGPNRAAEVTINDIGDIPYYCQAHPTMIGLVKVLEGSTPNDQYSIVATHEGQEFEIVGETSSPAKATNVTINPGMSVVVKFDGFGDTELTLPTAMIEGINSIETSDRKTVSFTTTNPSASATTIKLTVPPGDGSITIMGARVVPEFSMTVLLVAGSLAGVTIVAMKSRGRGMGF